MSPLTTWNELREDIDAAHVRAEAAYAAIGDGLMHGGKKSDALYDLTEALRTARDDLGRLSRMLAESSEPERPDRLAVALGKIRAFGHTCVTVDAAVYKGVPYSRCNSHLPLPEISEWRTRPYGEWVAEVERGEATVQSDDVAAAAEARLEQIRALRKQQRAAVVALVEALSYRGDPLSPEDIDAFMAAVEEADKPCIRWNVWAKHPGEGWELVNSNLNSEQAHAAVERLTRVDLLGVTFHALPVGQVPGGPPVTASDAVVFLNPDPEVQPITGPTDAEEAYGPDGTLNGLTAMGTPNVWPDAEEAALNPAVLNQEGQEKSCPECSHPMMSGPLQVNNPRNPDGPRITVAWWCANCHHSIEPDAEEAALARADHERERMASEEEEA